MLQKSTIPKLFAGAVIILLFLLLASCARSSASPMKVTMSILQEPIVGQTVDVQVKLVSSLVAPNTFFTLTVSSGVEVITGTTTWQGTLQPNEPVALNVAIRVKEPGEWPISAYAFSYDTPGERYGFGAGKGLYITSSAESATVIEDIYITPTSSGGAVTLFEGTPGPTGIPLTPYP